MCKFIFFTFIYLTLTACGFGQHCEDFFQRERKNQLCVEEEPVYFIAEAPLSMRKLWEQIQEHFSHPKNIKSHDSSWFSKWYQLRKLWSKHKNESGHYERKESIVITSDNTDLEMMKTCRKDLQSLCVKHLSTIERIYSLPKGVLTMENAANPSHTLRLLHYLPNAKATAHYDTSIMTCLYYRDRGLQLKVNGTWIEAPELKSNEMLITYGVPGEILSNGFLKAVRHRVQCDERYAIAYFHNTPKEYVLSSKNYNSTTMAHVYQEAQLWYANVNARVVRRYCKSTQLPWYVVLYGWLAQRWSPVNEQHISKKQKEIKSDK